MEHIKVIVKQNFMSPVFGSLQVGDVVTMTEENVNQLVKQGYVARAKAAEEVKEEPEEINEASEPELELSNLTKKQLIEKINTDLSLDLSPNTKKTKAELIVLYLEKSGQNG